MQNIDQQPLQTSVDEIRNRWPTVGMAVGVIRDGALESFCSDGFADVASKTPVTVDTAFRIASISKTFTAIAVMQLWERGLVDLDGPADHYLRGYQLIPANPDWRPATVRHLLTHTGGVPEWVHPSRMVNSGWFGESFGLRKRLPTLTEYYRGRLRLAVEPGTICTYSDHGYATLGQIVEDVSGLRLEDYLRENIFRPLGIADSDLLRSERIQAHLATGYRLGPNGARPVTDRQWVTSAASSIYSTPRDMARYVAALLGDLIGAPPSGIRADVPQHPEIWGDLSGWYRPRARVQQHAPTRSWPGACRTGIGRSGRCTGRPGRLFGRDPATATMSVHLDGLPLSAEQRPASANPGTTPGDGNRT